MAMNDYSFQQKKMIIQEKDIREGDEHWKKLSKWSLIVSKWFLLTGLPHVGQREMIGQLICHVSLSSNIS